jgi:hypothetical protein
LTARTKPLAIRALAEFGFRAGDLSMSARSLSENSVVKFERV